MNRGKIPGFYYDQEKKKYFAIQPNHIAPDNAKYARSEVKREQRATKKRKTEEKALRVRHKQTVKRSRLLQDPTSGRSTLSRELGSDQPGLGSDVQHEFLLQQARNPRVHPVRRTTPDTTVTDCVNLTAVGKVAVAHSRRNLSMVSVCPWPEHSRDSIQLDGANVDCFAAFNSAIASLVMQQWAAHDLYSVVACAQAATSPGNVFFGVCPFDAFGSSGDSWHRGIYLTVGSKTNSIWSAAPCKFEPWCAIAGTEEIAVLDLGSGHLQHSLKIQTESRCVDWLNSETVIYSQHAPEMNEGVRLWDIRSSGNALRFPLKKPVTGLAVGDDEVRIVVSDNKRTNVFDTRMNKKPVIFFNLVHQGPRIQSALFGPDIFAAFDAENILETYSLRTGKFIRSLKSPSQRERELFTNLRCFNGEHGPILQACQSERVVTWAPGDSD